MLSLVHLSAHFKWPVFIAASVSALFVLGVFEPTELSTQDLRFTMRGYTMASQPSDVVVVGITHQCFERLGEPPLERSLYALAIEQLTAAGARVIAFDICFPGATSAAEDERLATAAAEAGNVLFAVFCPEALRKYASGPIRHVNALRQNLPAFTRAALGLGHINVPSAVDGRRRAVPLSLEHDGRLYFSLGQESAVRYNEAASGGKSPQESVIRDVPLTDDGDFMINYTGRHTAVGVLPFHRVVNGGFDPEMVRNKLVLIGQTALGRPDADTVPTPLGEMYGVFVQATVADSMLTGQFLTRQSRASTLVTILVVATAAWLLFSRLPWGLSVPAWAGLTALTGLAAVALFNTHDFMLDSTPLLATLATAFVGGLMTNLKTTRETVRHQEVEFDSILQSGRIVAERSLAEDAPQTLVELIGRLLGAQVVTLSMVRHAQTWEWAAPGVPASGLDLRGLHAFERAAGAQLVQRREPFVTASLRTESEFPEPPPVAAFFSAPLVVGQEAVGVLNLYDKRGTEASPADTFTVEDMRMLTVLAQQAALLLDNVLLIRDLAEKNRQLTEALERLQETQAELVRTEKLSAVGKMAAMIIHDIRSPLTVIMGFADLMRGGDIGPEEAREHADTILKQTVRMNQMVQEILDFVRGTKSLVIEELAVDAFTREVAALLRDEIGSQSVTVRLGIDCNRTVRADRQKLTRVFLNLGRNAVQAMGGTGTISIGCRAAEGGVAFTVADDGPGIPEAIRERLFEPFVTAGKRQGTGLGLAIVRKIIDDHGGTVQVDSSTGSGTVFTISLPA